MQPAKATAAYLLCAALVCAAAGCGDLKRENPVDPVVSGGLTLKDQLVGSWSRTEGQNELYTFKVDNGVVLSLYSSPSGGEVDRNARETQVSVFAGTYSLLGSILTITFTSEDNVTLEPPDELRSEITVRSNTLTLTRQGVDRRYIRF